MGGGSCISLKETFDLLWPCPLAVLFGSQYPIPFAEKLSYHLCFSYCHLSPLTCANKSCSWKNDRTKGLCYVQSFAHKHGTSLSQSPLPFSSASLNSTYSSMSIIVLSLTFLPASGCTISNLSCTRVSLFRPILDGLLYSPFCPFTPLLFFFLTPDTPNLITCLYVSYYVYFTIHVIYSQKI